MTLLHEPHHAGPDEAPPVDHHDPMAGKLGMWLFLFSEIMMFGIMFVGYAVYHHSYAVQFRIGSGELDRVLGAANTLILLTSSLTMVLAIAAVARRRKGLAMLLLGATMLMALGFLGIKAFEWGTKFEHGLYPRSPVLGARAPGEQIFFGFYYLMTGLHALHVLAGVALVGAGLLMVRSGRVHAHRLNALDNIGLYWHLVDTVWIFLFPLFYLIQ